MCRLANLMRLNLKTTLKLIYLLHFLCSFGAKQSKMPTPFSLDAYDYTLPDDKIARFPLARREQAKMLHYTQRKIFDRVFYELPDLLPKGSQLYFNNTRVIPARLLFQKPTTVQGKGAFVEIFLLNPIAPTYIIGEAMMATSNCRWHCMIGNQKRWKDGQVLEKKLTIGDKKILLSALLVDRTEKLVEFRWEDKNLRFVDIVEASGQVPLPPYIKRETVDEDRPRYQTVYSKKEGAVAAPTAGLHFTPEVIEQLRRKRIDQQYLTLHVSAGTFQPIKEADVKDHQMHSEQIIVTRQNVKSLLNSVPEKPTVAVGTTSLRTLESLYWYGVMLLDNPDAVFKVPKLIAYERLSHRSVSLKVSMGAVLNLMDNKKLDQLIGETEIFIFPGYKFRVIDGLVTNFHMPKSTLVLLIAALVGEDWKQIYDHALANDYRFLSYGDSSLLMPSLVS